MLNHKGYTVCGCTSPYLACFIAVPVMAVASAMWHAAGRAARVATDGQVCWRTAPSQRRRFVPAWRDSAPFVVGLETFMVVIKELDLQVHAVATVSDRDSLNHTSIVI